jgi:hypothetical protein
MNMADIPISIGELFDKISILQIKQEKIKDAIKLKHVDHELELLTSKLESLNLEKASAFIEDIKEINLILWDIEDEIRVKEKQGDFDKEFVSLARSVYKTNDERFLVKNKINEFYGSNVVEVKSYEKYE